MKDVGRVDCLCLCLVSGLVGFDCWIIKEGGGED